MTTKKKKGNESKNTKPLSEYGNITDAVRHGLEQERTDELIELTTINPKSRKSNDSSVSELIAKSLTMDEDKVAYVLQDIRPRVYNFDQTAKNVAKQAVVNTKVPNASITALASVITISADELITAMNDSDYGRTKPKSQTKKRNKYKCKRLAPLLELAGDQQTIANDVMSSAAKRKDLDVLRECLKHEPDQSKVTNIVNEAVEEDDVEIVSVVLDEITTQFERTPFCEDKWLKNAIDNRSRIVASHLLERVDVNRFNVESNIKRMIEENLRNPYDKLTELDPKNTYRYPHLNKAVNKARTYFVRDQAKNINWSDIDKSQGEKALKNAREYLLKRDDDIADEIEAAYSAINI